jgi:TonB-dependent receptor
MPLARWLGLAGVALAIAAAPAPVQAQSARGKLTGRVLAKDSGEPMGFADVMLLPLAPAGKRSGGMTNADGSYLLEAEPGAYTLQVRALSYRTKLITGITVVGGKTIEMSIQVEPEAIEQQEVQVEAARVTNTEGAMLSARRNASSVGDAVSAEQVRKSPDRDVADVLKRVTGASIVDNKYVYVRGLGERYSSTSIDGVRVTSPEPGKRVVPLDLVPASLLENVVVQKTYTADRPGEFGGGDVQVLTKAFPGRRTVNASLSQGYDDGSTFRHGFRTYGSDGSDALGFGTGSRALPALVAALTHDRAATAANFGGDTLEAMGRAFRNEWSPRRAAPGPNGSGQLSYGDELEIAGRSLGLVGSVSWSRSHDSQDEVQRFYGVLPAADTLTSYKVRKWTENVLLGGTAGLSYRLAPRHTLHLRGTYSNASDDEVRTHDGYFKSRDLDLESTRLRYVRRQIASTSVAGDHDLPNLRQAKVSWQASFSSSNRDEPDRREFTYQALRDGDGNPAAIQAFSGAGREFGDLHEEGRGLEAKIQMPLPVGTSGRARVEVGGSVQDRDRVSTYRRFGFLAGGQFPESTPPESVYQSPRWGDAGTGAGINEDTNDFDAYDADFTVRAAYVSGDVPLPLGVRLVAGVRVEDATQDVRTYNQFTGVTAVDPSTGRVQDAQLRNTDWLPTVNLIYPVNDRINVRAAMSRTLSRPDVRELNPGFTLDFIGGFRFRGNPDLERASIWNYDVRVETFPSVSEVLAVSGFYKDFSDPIEYAILPSDQPLIAPVNSDEGRNLGVELESRVQLSRFTKALDNVAINLNASFISSRVTLGQQALLGSVEHPLQGQSKSLVNAGLSYAHPKGLWNGTVLLNAVGRRLINIAVAEAHDIYDDPTTTLDLTFDYRPLSNWRLKLSGSNLLDTTFRSRQGEKVWREYKTGRSIALAASFGS